MRWLKWLTKPIRFWMPSQWERTLVQFPLPSLAGYSDKMKNMAKIEMMERIARKKVDMRKKGWRMFKVYQSGPYMLAAFRRLK